MEDQSRVLSLVFLDHYRTKESIGLLKLNGDEEIFAIDGQHRVEGIKEALKKSLKLRTEEQCIIFVAHKKTEEGRERTRRLFSTLNKKAVRVSQGELVALDEDDSFAITVRKLVDNYKPLNEKLVPLTPNTNIPNNNESCITTVLGLYNLVKIIECSKDRNGSIKRNRLIEGPPNKKEIENIYNGHIEFWEALRKYIPEVLEVTNSAPSRCLAGEYRHDDGGHILFRPVGQSAFANAVRIMLDRGISLDSAVSDLSKVPLSLTALPWKGILWNPTAKIVINKNGLLAQNLFLYMVRQKLPPKSKRQEYPLENMFREALDDPTAKISSIRQVAVSRLRGYKP